MKAYGARWRRRFGVALGVVALVGLTGLVQAAPVENVNIRTTNCEDISFSVIEAPNADSPLPGYQIVLDDPVRQPEDGFIPGNPIVFGLMITGKDLYHEYLGRKSMDCFLNQTYDRKVLIVVNDSPEYSMVDGPSEWLRARQLPEPPRERSCVVELRVPPRQFVLGDLRNIAINAVPLGAVWVQWDDDELENMFKRHALVGYMAAEYNLYMQLNSTWRFTTSANIFHDCIHPFSPRQKKTDPQGLHGTIMAYKSSQIAELQYPSLGRAEDSKFWNQLRENKISHTSLNNDPWLYFKLFHGTNTWGAAHAGQQRGQNDVWCTRDEGFGCDKETANEYHRFVLSVYRDWHQVFGVDPTTAA
ncbi:uncharacterized protein MONBRDRAFT_10406 [Monosiga brevicollis MX1]|uniref:Uncharacterized protein n=1 Tax=Monosiga brevicollis TaxID=81824 RepID=A9V644_MONBE|nr:uncharacterized protein MONBRDRAFT_10406 [Monosiga brevicollis MX1]EDQ86923.1 predicted protein [Monosiga brevicollis MX1]|eukprot:XP_001748162.1 hypothetical protein [Monosiga brevicollis MX1]